MIPYPLPELIDRLSICELKVERIGEASSQKEFSYLKKAIDQYEESSFTFHEFISWYNRLYEINKTIWDLEADIRRGLDEKLGMDEIGRRAIKIREANKVRVSIKNEIAKRSNSGFEDVKVNHVSV